MLTTISAMLLKRKICWQNLSGGRTAVKKAERSRSRLLIEFSGVEEFSSSHLLIDYSKEDPEQNHAAPTQETPSKLEKMRKLLVLMRRDTSILELMNLSE